MLSAHRSSVAPWLLMLAALWGPIIYLLGAQWTFFQQYNYGWAVPVLCAYLAWERWQRSKLQTSTSNIQPPTSNASEGGEQTGKHGAGSGEQRTGSVERRAVVSGQSSEVGSQKTADGLPISNLQSPSSKLAPSTSNIQPPTSNEPEVGEQPRKHGAESGKSSKLRHPTLNSQLSTLNFGNPALWLLVLCGVLLWATRVLQEANPIWRAASYGLAVEGIAITLLLLYLTGGTSQVRRFAFPIVFFLVAVPWPTPVELGVIQNLTRLNAAVVVELLNAFGIPALARGNVIEVSTGVVGIDEACSGIRSVQATIMVSLFFGEYYRLRPLRRVGMVLGGLGSALVFNMARMFLLTWVASRDGTQAIEKWHDPAGVTILVACFLFLWGLGAWLGKRRAGSREQGAGSRERGEGSAVVSNQESEVGSQWSVVGGQTTADGLPISNLQSPISHLEHPTFNIQHSTSNGTESGRQKATGGSGEEHSTLNIQHPTSNKTKSEGQNSKLQAPSSKLPNPSTLNSQTSTSAEDGVQKTEDRGQRSEDSKPPHCIRPLNSDLWHLTLTVVAWVLLVEISTEVWFRSHEVRGHKAIPWSVRWPERNPTFEAKTFPATIREMLQYNEGQSGAWVEADRSVWQAFYLRWLPGRSFYDRMRVALAKSHNPEICLQASGLVLRRELEPVVVHVQDGFNLAFRRFLFEAGGKPLHVFFSGTEDVQVTGTSGFLRMTHRERLEAALAGSRNFGQRNFEVAISGFDDPVRALREFEEKLPGLVAVADAR